jgi:hypothetical protein
VDNLKQRVIQQNSILCTYDTRTVAIIQMKKTIGRIQKGKQMLYYNMGLATSNELWLCQNQSHVRRAECLLNSNPLPQALARGFIFRVFLMAMFDCVWVVRLLVLVESLRACEGLPTRGATIRLDWHVCDDVGSNLNAGSVLLLAV